MRPAPFGSISPGFNKALAAGVLMALLAACSDAGPTPTEPAPTPSLAKGGVKGPPGNNDGGGTAPAEDFDTWPSSVWVAGDHPLGRGYLDPDNVGVAGGFLEIALPAGTFDGGELRSVDQYRYGTYTARVRAAAAPGSLTAFFLYEGTDRNIDEIDVEILGDGSRTALFTTWLRGVETNHVSTTLDFDPTADFHEYSIEFTRRRIRFRVDGALRATFTQDLPGSRMYIMVNAWWPTWLEAQQPDPPQSATAAVIDWIDY